jgi:putative chitinase
MPITQQQLLQVLPRVGAKAGVLVLALNMAMSKYGILGWLRVAAFLRRMVTNLVCSGR